MTNCQLISSLICNLGWASNNWVHISGLALALKYCLQLQLTVTKKNVNVKSNFSQISVVWHGLWSHEKLLTDSHKWFKSTNLDY